MRTSTHAHSQPTYSTNYAASKLIQLRLHYRTLDQLEHGSTIQSIDRKVVEIVSWLKTKETKEKKDSLYGLVSRSLNVVDFQCLITYLLAQDQLNSPKWINVIPVLHEYCGRDLKGVSIFVMRIEQYTLLIDNRYAMAPLCYV
jgi:hypothetical protein